MAVGNDSGCDGARNRPGHQDADSQPRIRGLENEGKHLLHYYLMSIAEKDLPDISKARQEELVHKVESLLAMPLWQKEK